MKRMVMLIIMVTVTQLGCVAYDTTGKVLNKTGSIISDVMSGGKIHITLGLETDAAYNNEAEE